MCKLKEGNLIKKILRILLYVVTAGLLLLGVVYALLQLPYVQTNLVQYVTERIERATGVKVQVGGVDFRPVQSLVLSDILVKDFKNDTLLYCRNVRVQADSFSWRRRTFNVREVVLTGAEFHLWSDMEENVTNVGIFLDSLMGRSAGMQEEVGERKRRVAEKGWWVGLRKISLRDSRFTYREKVYKPVDYGVNWTDVDCRELNAEVTELDGMNSPVRMRVSNLSLLEKSGLRINDITGDVQVSADNLLVTGGHIGLERSDVDLMRLEFQWTPGQHDWKYFTKRVQQYYELGPSSVSFVDLAYFNGILRGITNTVKCSGVVSNTIDRLEGRDLYFELGTGSVFQGSFKSLGLPDMKRAFFNIELGKAHFKPEDLASVYLPWFGMNIPVPSFLYRLPSLDFERVGFDGTLSDFIVQAESVTPDWQGDLSLIYGFCDEKVPECADMRGDFNWKTVNFGKLADVSWLQDGALNGSYEGWLGDKISFRAKSKAERLRVGKSRIEGTELALMWEDGRLDVAVSVDDAAVRGEVAALLDAGDSVAFHTLMGQVQILDMDALGIGIKEGKECLEGAFEWVTVGEEGKMFRNLTLSEIKYATGEDSLELERVRVENLKEHGYGVMSVESEVLDLTLEGNYGDVQPLLFIKELVENYLPAYHSGGKPQMRLGRKYLERFNFGVVADLKDADRILRVLYPALHVSGGARAVADFSNTDDRMHLNFTADTMAFGEIKLLEPRIVMTGDPNRLDMVTTSGRMLYGTDYQLCNVRNEMVLGNNRLDEHLSWCNWGEKTYSGMLSACAHFTPREGGEYATEIQIQPGTIIAEDSVWTINPSSVLVEGKEWVVNNFSLVGECGTLKVDGRISEDTRATLNVGLENFDLTHLTRLVSNRNLNLFGTVTGMLTFQDYYQNLLLLSDVQVDAWGINRDTLGMLKMLSYWDAESRSLMLNAENREGEEVSMAVSGSYKPDSDTLNLRMNMQELELERFGSYFSDVVSEVKGGLSGNLEIRGTTKEPEISGMIVLDSIWSKVNELNTRYWVHAHIPVDKNRLILDNFTLHDVRDDKAVMNGEYRLLENRYKVNVLLENLRVLNTKAVDNELFYGLVNLSGLAELHNEDGMMNVTVNARTEPGSHLYVPMTAEGLEQANNCLRFVHTGRMDVSRRQERLYTSDINLNANLEVNDNLEVQVIFDPTVGDVLKTVGSGNIKVGFDRDGSLSMFGEYGIMKGDYLFTLSDLVNKRFVLTPGGTITWSGSPYDAMLNLNAVYNLKASISDLLPVEITEPEGPDGEEKVTESGRKVPVECILNMTDNLSNPTVKFDINFPTLASQNRGYIQSVLSTQDEINKQMVSLLVLNRFYRTDNTNDYQTQAQTLGVGTVTEMMSNQLSNWLSQISQNVDIGVTYRMGDPDKEVSSDEIELALSTQFLNDRVTISANGNVDVGNTRNTDKKTNIAGDFDLEVKLNKQGTLKMKAYSHTNEKVLYNNTEMIQGVGVSYQESFDTFRELLRKYFGFLKRKK